MENAVEALKTAAAVLVFIIAITLAFLMFSKTRVTADAITTMQDKQEYLEEPTVDRGILYTSSTAIGAGYIATMTTAGDRIVEVDDVISTIYRYNIEKYGVTIVKNNGTVLARFDSNTENIMRQWYNISAEKNGDGKTAKQLYIEKLAENTRNGYANPIFDYKDEKDNTLYNIYRIQVDGNTQIECGAPWYGNQSEIIKRCNADIAESTATAHTYKLNGQTYIGKDLYTQLTAGNYIVEVTKEIDQSKYLDDATDGKTDLLQEYQMPTIEIIYIIR